MALPGADHTHTCLNWTSHLGHLERSHLPPPVISLVSPPVLPSITSQASFVLVPRLPPPLLSSPDVPGLDAREPPGNQASVAPAAAHHHLGTLALALAQAPRLRLNRSITQPFLPYRRSARCSHARLWTWAREIQI